MLSGERSVYIFLADKGASGIVNINIDLDSQFDSLATTVKCLRIKTNKKIDESISSCQLKNIKLTVEKIDNEGEQLTVTVC